MIYFVHVIFTMADRYQPAQNNSNKCTKCTSFNFSFYSDDATLITHERIPNYHEGPLIIASAFSHTYSVC